MTETIEWLKKKIPGFSNLAGKELNAIADFSLLWSLFESRILNTEGNVANICNAIQAWHDAETLDVIAFDEELTYFRKRYFANGNFTNYFDDLRFRSPDREALVRAVIDGSNEDPCNRMAAILIIIFRFRNNLFHGVKWQYNLQGQLGNFATANRALMKVLDQHGALAEIYSN